MHNTAVNLDPTLEHEADIMSSQAVRQPFGNPLRQTLQTSQSSPTLTAQFALDEIDSDNFDGWVTNFIEDNKQNYSEGFMSKLREQAPEIKKFANTYQEAKKKFEETIAALSGSINYNEITGHYVNPETMAVLHRLRAGSFKTMLSHNYSNSPIKYDDMIEKYRQTGSKYDPIKYNPRDNTYKLEHNEHKSNPKLDHIWQANFA